MTTYSFIKSLCFQTLHFSVLEIFPDIKTLLLRLWLSNPKCWLLFRWAQSKWREWKKQILSSSPYYIIQNQQCFILCSPSLLCPCQLASIAKLGGYFPSQSDTKASQSSAKKIFFVKCCCVCARWRPQRTYTEHKLILSFTTGIYMHTCHICSSPVWIRN